MDTSLEKLALSEQSEDASLSQGPLDLLAPLGRQRLTYSAAARDGICGWLVALDGGIDRVAGRGKRKMALRPGALSSRISSALWKCATAATSARPKPVPGEWRQASSRTKRSTTRGRSLTGMPGPLSPTQSSTPLNVRPDLMVTLPPGGVYLMALSTRLASAWEMRLRLPSITVSAAPEGRIRVRLTFFSSARGSYNSLTSAATETRSSGDMAPRAVPASVSAISSRALKVPIN